jgi:fucose permease
MLAMGAVLLVAGAAMAPGYATIYAMADHAAPAGTATEAFSWLSTAAVAGTAAGTAAAGTLAQHAGAGAVFALAGLGGALAVAVTLLWSRTINRQAVTPPVTTMAPAPQPVKEAGAGSAQELADEGVGHVRVRA